MNPITTQMAVTRSVGGPLLVFSWMADNRFIPRGKEIKVLLMDRDKGITIETTNGSTVHVAPCYDDFPSQNKINADVLALAHWISNEPMKDTN